MLYIWILRHWALNWKILRHASYLIISRLDTYPSLEEDIELMPQHFLLSNKEDKFMEKVLTLAKRHCPGVARSENQKTFFSNGIKMLVQGYE